MSADAPDPEHDARIRADERARVLAAVLEKLRIEAANMRADEGAGRSLRMPASDVTRALGDMLSDANLDGDALPDGDTALKDLLARERQEAWEAGYETMKHEAGVNAAANLQTFQTLNAARAHGAKEALTSAADSLDNRWLENAFRDWLRARAAAIDPTTYVDTLRAEAAASELERLITKHERGGRDNNTPITVADLRARAAELRAAAGKGQP